MTDVFISYADTVDPRACQANPDMYEEKSRDPSRTPFQWDSSVNGGFSKTRKKTWLPLANNYTKSNVLLQKIQSVSHFKVFKKLVALRQLPAFKCNDFNTTTEIKTIDCDILTYRRITCNKDCGDIFIVVLNFASTSKSISLTDIFDGIPKAMKVVVASIDSNHYKNG